MRADKKEALWLQIAEEKTGHYYAFWLNRFVKATYLCLHVLAALCKAQFKDLRDSYKRKAKEKPPSGTGAKAKRQWIFFEQMSFLKDEVAFAM